MKDDTDQARRAHACTLSCNGTYVLASLNLRTSADEPQLCVSWILGRPSLPGTNCTESLMAVHASQGRVAR